LPTPSICITTPTTLPGLVSTEFPSPATAQAAPEALPPFSKPNGSAGICHYRTNAADPVSISGESTERCKVGYDSLQAWTYLRVNAFRTHFLASVDGFGCIAWFRRLYLAAFSRFPESFRFPGHTFTTAKLGKKWF
jgi:hypothetical protein